MSTLCLLYPKKPQEVADDLESIVYILVRLALRFHKHEKSLKYDPGSRSSDDIRKANATNEDLATLVSSFFDVQIECEDGYWSGGSSKKDWLETYKLPVKLLPGPDGKQTPLAKLLRSLYALLRQHYGAINYSDLERFKVEKRTSGVTVEVDENKARLTEETNESPEPPVDTNLPPPPKTLDALSRIRSRMTKARDEEEEDSSDDDDEDEDEEETQTPASDPSSNFISVITIPNPRRVLDTHAEIIKAFGNILFKNKRQTKARDLSKYNYDKWYDQFDGLKAALNFPEMNPSGQTMKRKKHYELYEEVLEEGRKKRVRGSTYRVHIPYTVIEQPEPDREPDTIVDETEKY